ncbi:MAG: hypothetical protein JKY89_07835 [Immundisolibacteraceae bacterium]|nr:hypothetical protein [Immundisolibacteraceae bacterium]
MKFESYFNAAWLKQLIDRPDKTFSDQFDGASFTARISIPDYGQRLLNYYPSILKGGLAAYSHRVQIPFEFNHFGVEINFLDPVQLELHDNDSTLNDGLRELTAIVGPVIIRNATMVAKLRIPGHKNRFPHLNFHCDRNESQPTIYSMYTRDPYDEEQKYPRTSSTLFGPSILGSLQTLKEAESGFVPATGAAMHYSIFAEEDMGTVLDNVVVEHAWDQPMGVGEISMLDNRTCLHASYYRQPLELGYKIGVRYLK